MIFRIFTLCVKIKEDPEVKNFVIYKRHDTFNSRKHVLVKMFYAKKSDSQMMQKYPSTIGRREC